MIHFINGDSPLMISENIFLPTPWFNDKKFFISNQVKNVSKYMYEHKFTNLKKIDKTKIISI